MGPLRQATPELAAGEYLAAINQEVSTVHDELSLPRTIDERRVCMSWVLSSIASIDVLIKILS